MSRHSKIVNFFEGFAGIAAAKIKVHYLDIVIYLLWKNKKAKHSHLKIAAIKRNFERSKHFFLSAERELAWWCDIAEVKPIPIREKVQGLLENRKNLTFAKKCDIIYPCQTEDKGYDTAKGDLN